MPPYHIVDAFSDHLFAGNPAGVCVLTHALPVETMQSIAAENNLAETAFVVIAPNATPHTAPHDTAHLRWFTPTQEVDLCGHATLAAAHVLFEHHDWPHPAVHFTTQTAGPLIVAHDSTPPKRLRMNFPARPAEPCAAPDGLADALGAQPTHVATARDLLAVFDHAKDIRALSPTMQALAQLDAFAIIATAPSDDPAHDFVSRFFAPGAGVNEDPVTGSAHCTLAPYWAQRLGKTKLIGHQVSARGGVVHCQLRGDRVHLSGHATTYLSGQLHLPS